MEIKTVGFFVYEDTNGMKDKMKIERVVMKNLLILLLQILLNLFVVRLFDLQTLFMD